MMPFPQPAPSFAHHHSSVSVCNLLQFPPQKGFIVYAGGFAHTILELSPVKSGGGEGEDAGGAGE